MIVHPRSAIDWQQPAVAIAAPAQLQGWQRRACDPQLGTSWWLGVPVTALVMRLLRCGLWLVCTYCKTSDDDVVHAYACPYFT